MPRILRQRGFTLAELAMVLVLPRVHAVRQKHFLEHLEVRQRRLRNQVDHCLTRTPSGRAMFQMLGVFAEFERAMIVERVRSGIARARVKGTKSGRPIGRPRVGFGVEREILASRRKGVGQLKIARQLGIGVSVVQRVVGTTAS
jgi:DNA invertase Pin-like site-specific DNA recombinase